MPFVDTTAARCFATEKMQKLGLFETQDLFCDVYCLEPGQAQKPHAHDAATKFYYVIEGRASIQIGDERRDLGPGALAWAAPGEVHGVENLSTGRLALLVVMAPNPNPGA